MNTVYVRDLIVVGTHGLLAREKHVRQRFKVSITCELDGSEDWTSGAIATTVDYRKLVKIAEQVLGGPPLDLVEALSSRIADAVLALPFVAAVEVDLEKLDVWPVGVPGVISRRTGTSRSSRAP